MRTFLLPLALLGVMGCTPDETGEDIDNTVSDDGGTDDPVPDPGFSATIVAQRPAFMPVFQLQSAADDQAEMIPMACGGNSVCTAKLDEPGSWRLWGTAEGWLITYNKVVAATQDGETTKVMLDQFGDYGVNLTDLVYEDEDGERYATETTYNDGQVVLNGIFGLDNVPMLGYECEGTVPGHLYTVSCEVTPDYSSITHSMFDENGDVMGEWTYHLVE